VNIQLVWVDEDKYRFDVINVKIVFDMHATFGTGSDNPAVLQRNTEIKSTGRHSTAYKRLVKLDLHQKYTNRPTG